LKTCWVLGIIMVNLTVNPSIWGIRHSKCRGKEWRRMTKNNFWDPDTMRKEGI
jgi:hypothetical protein